MIQLTKTFLITIFILLFSNLDAFAKDECKWQTLSKGLELCERDFSFSTDIALLRLDPKFTDLSLIFEPNSFDSIDLVEYGKKNSLEAVINANFFTPETKPLGWVIKDGKIYNQAHSGGRALTGIFSMQKDGSFIITHRSNFSPQNSSLAIQAGPRLIKNSKKISIDSKDSSSNRSAIALTNDGKIILVSTVGFLSRITLAELRDFLLTLNVKDALNLDGGSSTSFYIKKLDRAYSIGTKVPVGITVHKKEQNKDQKKIKDNPQVIQQK